VRKLLLCTGKVYYDLEKQRADTGAKDVAIVRIEQVAPFPFDLVAKEVARYPNAKVAFVQEEPRNMGAWSYVAPRIHTATRVINKKPVHAVRTQRAFPPPPPRRLGSLPHSALSPPFPPSRRRSTPGGGRRHHPQRAR
jgi:2-oxoglutarate dehydrogenase E1 component